MPVLKRGIIAGNQLALAQTSRLRVYFLIFWLLFRQWRMEGSSVRRQTFTIFHVALFIRNVALAGADWQSVNALRSARNFRLPRRRIGLPVSFL